MTATAPSGIRWQRVRPIVVTVGLLLITAADFAYALIGSDTAPTLPTIVSGAAAGAAVLVRHRWPLAAFVASLPALSVVGAIAAPAITLFCVAAVGTQTWVVVASAVVAALAGSLPTSSPTMEISNIVDFAYFLAGSAAPALLGRLTMVQRELRQKLLEVGEAQEHERQLYAQTVLARERAQIGREMHDVVSHHVSLIAVRAATMLVGDIDDRVRTEATTIRRLAVATLDELRHLVIVLRASGGSRSDTRPQPSLDQVDSLISTSGIDVDVDGQLPDQLPAAWQRAIYRTIQEALTNIRKHAPGASATISFGGDTRNVRMSIVNRPSARPALNLPGTGEGLIGLRERAELLGATFDAGPRPDGGFEVALSFPVTGLSGR
ncbi:two-component sensor histidine kinase [Gordonia oryzae]|uniref:histidine kinase n=1 Tax=Gordonia oryzae TaxID=2487349 RepID=A0A3N4GWQ9_9ACTN|nr:histidine kinase [Gordonia oryzae]RPA65867.1 two-component sensor histidine kinase [Gordonia oryzae]